MQTTIISGSSYLVSQQKGQRVGYAQDVRRPSVSRQLILKELEVCAKKRVLPGVTTVSAEAVIPENPVMESQVFGYFVKFLMLVAVCTGCWVFGKKSAYEVDIVKQSWAEVKKYAGKKSYIDTSNSLSMNKFEFPYDQFPEFADQYKADIDRQKRLEELDMDMFE